MMGEKHGRVLFYDPEREYGFVQIDNDDGQLFFHYNNGRRIESSAQGPFFSHLPVRDQLGRQLYRLAQPQAGDRLVFTLVSSMDGKPKAKPWGYEVDWNQIVDENSRRDTNRSA